MRKVLFVLFLPVLWGQEKVDLSVVNRIKAEAFQNSKVMEHAFYLSDVHGPRLTGSAGEKAAGEWVVKRMKEWGLVEPRLEKWGPYGRGWENLRFAAHMKEPQYQPLIGVPRPLTPGTNGAVTGEAVLAPLYLDADFEQFRGKLKGKIVLIEEPRVPALSSEPLSRRLTDADLVLLAQAPDPSRPYETRAPEGRVPGIAPGQPYSREAASKFRNKLNQFLKDEGVLLTLVASYRADGGTVFANPAGSRDVKEALPPPSAALTAEHYNRIVRLLRKNVPVKLEFDIDNRMVEDAPVFNVIADLPGAGKGDEVVMIGGHIDSWTFGTGAADNAAGCAVMMEAMRILKALDLKMPRTVRMGLWSAEEQGLLGSRAYVKANFADRETMALKPAHAKLSGYFNLDNGTGKIRGVYLQENDTMRPVFEAWLAPFRDLGAATVAIRNTTGTDHLAFDAVGLPGFQFIQDPVEYMTRAHHSNMDVYDRLQEGDLMQASAIVASIVYHAATREELLPRKPLPKPQPAGSKTN